MMSNGVAPGAADRAQALFGGLTEGRWEEAHQQFDEYMRGYVDAEGIAQRWKDAAGFAGRFEQAGEPSTPQAGDYTVVEVPLFFAGGKGIGRVAYDCDGKVAGLSLQCRRRHRLDPRRGGGFALSNPDAAELIALGQRRRGGFRKGTRLAVARFSKFLRNRRLQSVCLWVMALGLFATTAVALWIGFQDLFSPLSLAGQFLGLVYFIAGLAGLAGLISLAGLAKPHLGKKLGSSRGNRTKPLTWPIAFVFGGAVAGCYVDATIAWYSFKYRVTITWTFIALALLCFCLACVTLPALSAVWKDISKSLKGVGISAALLGLAAQFWYLSIYSPENSPVGIDYTFAVASVVRSGHNRLVQVHLTIEDAGSVPALDLGSIVVVRGISDPGGYSTILRVLQPFGTGDFIFPNDTYSSDFLVDVTTPAINALNINLTLFFARTTWLSLGAQLGNGTRHFPHCTPKPPDARYEWYINQSHLRQFAQGDKVLHSNYCRYPDEPKNPEAPKIGPYVSVGITGIHGGQLVPIPDQSPVESDLGIIESNRDETLLIT
jgi:FtsH-binding integral membrane protein